MYVTTAADCSCASAAIGRGSSDAGPVPPTCKTCCLLLDAFTTRIQCKHRAVPNLLLCGTSSAVLRLVVILTATTPALESVGMFKIFFN
jgi:hypothetical protein